MHGSEDHSALPIGTALKLRPDRPWTVCCSGGGIRSAAYCLGALQRLRETDPGIGSRPGDVVVGVSGGAYIAAARALAVHEKPDETPFAPGSEAERRLRNNTHYLAPDGKTITAALLSLLYGASIIGVILLAPVFVAAHLLGWLYRATGVLSWPVSGSAGEAGVPAVDVTHWGWWLAPAVSAAICVAVFLFWHRRAGRPQTTWPTQALGWLSVLTAVVVLATMVIPSAVWALDKARAWNGGIAFGSAPVLSVVAFASTVAALFRAGFGQARRGATDVQNLPEAAKGMLARLGKWARRALLPWLAVTLIVLVAVSLGLWWASDGSLYGALTHYQWQQTAIAFGILVLGRFVDMNKLSMHSFYRWRLAEGYGDPVAGSAKLSELRGPLGQDGSRKPSALVIAAAANINAPGEAAPSMGAWCITFDPVNVTLWGPKGADAAEMGDLERIVGPGRMTLFDVVAMSGAAVSPLMGHKTRAAYRLPLTVANVRLGQWMPAPKIIAGARETLGPKGNETGKKLGTWWLAIWYPIPHPRWAVALRDRRRAAINGEDRERRLWAIVLRYREMAENGSRRGSLIANALYRWLQPSLGLLWAETVGHCSYRQSWIYVSDGGHYDNSGLIAGLRRQNEQIILLDAGGDAADHWTTVGQAIALARVEESVSVSVDPSTMRPKNGDDGTPATYLPGQVLTPWVAGTFTPAPAPTHEPGRLWVCKLGWWDKASWDVRSYAAEHPTYPTQSTLQQLYDADEFEAYRVLGYEAAEAAITG